MDVMDVSWFLIGMAIIGQMMGGLLDMSGRKEIFGVSKQHLWKDSAFLLLLVIALNVMYKLK